MRAGSAEQARAVYDLLNQNGVRCRVMGGWGVDAQTPAGRDRPRRRGRGTEDDTGAALTHLPETGPQSPRELVEWSRQLSAPIAA
jgi:hypothetical protein